jgi:signal transduction histidine kinase
LRSAARDITLSSDVRVHVEAPETMRRLEANVEYSLMRIAREAITNALKHSQAVNLEVTLKPDGEIGVLTVQDDGIGFATNHDVEGHYGIVGMRERALEIGAALTITSSPGHGTAVRVQFPMNSPDRASAAVHAGRSQTLSAGDPK